MTKFRVTKEFLHEGDITFISKRGGVGVARFSADFLMSHGTETFVGETFNVTLFRVLKNFIQMRDMSRFSVENFLFLSTEKIFKGTVLCFRKFLVWKKIRDKKAGVTFSVGNFLSHVAEKHRG